MPKSKRRKLAFGMERLGEMMHIRYYKCLRDLNTALSINIASNEILEELELKEIELEGVCFNIKIGNNEWIEYEYIPHSATEYFWFEVGTKMILFKGEYGL